MGIGHPSLHDAALYHFAAGPHLTGAAPTAAGVIEKKQAIRKAVWNCNHATSLKFLLHAILIGITIHTWQYETAISQGNIMSYSLSKTVLQRVISKINKQRESSKELELDLTEIEGEIVYLFKEFKHHYYARIKDKECKDVGDFERWGFWHVATNALFSLLNAENQKNYEKEYYYWPEMRERRVSLMLDSNNHLQFIDVARKNFDGENEPEFNHKLQWQWKSL